MTRRQSETLGGDGAGRGGTRAAAGMPQHCSVAGQFRKHTVCAVQYSRGALDALVDAVEHARVVGMNRDGIEAKDLWGEIPEPPRVRVRHEQACANSSRATVRDCRRQGSSGHLDREGDKRVSRRRASSAGAGLNKAITCRGPRRRPGRPRAPRGRCS